MCYLINKLYNQPHQLGLKSPVPRLKEQQNKLVRIEYFLPNPVTDVVRSNLERLRKDPKRDIEHLSRKRETHRPAASCVQ